MSITTQQYAGVDPCGKFARVRMHDPLVTLTLHLVRTPSVCTNLRPPLRQYISLLLIHCLLIHCFLFRRFLLGWRLPQYVQLLAQIHGYLRLSYGNLRIESYLFYWRFLRWCLLCWFFLPLASLARNLLHRYQPQATSQRFPWKSSCDGGCLCSYPALAGRASLDRLDGCRTPEPP